MYLVVGRNFPEQCWQTPDNPLNAKLKGLVVDGVFNVFRFHEGKYQKVKVFHSEGAGGVKRWEHEWEDVSNKLPDAVNVREYTPT